MIMLFAIIIYMLHLSIYPFLLLFPTIFSNNLSNISLVLHTLLFFISILMFFIFIHQFFYHLLFYSLSQDFSYFITYYINSIFIIIMQKLLMIYSLK